MNAEGLEKCAVILLDVAGTIGSLNFVKETLLPYAKGHAEEYLKAHWEEEEVKEAVKLICEEGDQAKCAEAFGKLTDDGSDRKEVKLLQGLIYKQGYESGDLKAHVFGDVKESLEQWSKTRKIGVYSTGSVAAQKLYIGHTTDGDLSAHVEHYFDQDVGPKTEAASYGKIAEKFNVKPEEVAFITDDINEAKASKEAGCISVLALREGNAEIPEDQKKDFIAVTSFSELLISGKRKTPDDDATTETPPSKIAKTDETTENKTEEKKEESMEVETEKTETKAESKPEETKPCEEDKKEAEEKTAAVEEEKMDCTEETKEAETVAAAKEETPVEKAKEEVEDAKMEEEKPVEKEEEKAETKKETVEAKKVEVEMKKEEAETKPEEKAAEETKVEEKAVEKKEVKKVDEETKEKVEAEEEEKKTVEEPAEKKEEEKTVVEMESKKAESKEAEVKEDKPAETESKSAETKEEAKVKPEEAETKKEEAETKTEKAETKTEKAEAASTEEPSQKDNNAEETKAENGEEKPENGIEEEKENNSDMANGTEKNGDVENGKATDAEDEIKVKKIEEPAESTAAVSVEA